MRDQRLLWKAVPEIEPRGLDARLEAAWIRALRPREDLRGLATVRAGAFGGRGGGGQNGGVAAHLGGLRGGENGGPVRS